MAPLVCNGPADAIRAFDATRLGEFWRSAVPGFDSDLPTGTHGGTPTLPPGGGAPDPELPIPIELVD